MRYQLRDYQLKAVEDARTLLRKGKKRPLVVAPTGSGKTVIACEIVESATRKGSRTLFIAHRLELIEQTSAKLDEIGIDHGVIKAGHPRVRPELPVQVGSVQTLARRTARGQSAPSDFNLVIVDEAHHVSADSYLKVLNATPDAVVLGLTATPFRADGKALGDVFDSLVQVTNLADLIDAGHLVEPRVFGRQPPDLSHVKTVGRDYNLGQLAHVMDTVELVDDLVEAWKAKAAGRTTVAFAVSIEHSKHIAAAFLRAGIPAGHVDGEMTDQQRSNVLARLSSKELQVVSNCAILTEGWDLPRCSCVILARPTKSRSLWKQMCGRALRPAPEINKVDCLILDHSGCWKRHGFLTDPDPCTLQGREPQQGSAPVMHCPECKAEFLGWPRFCPECGKPLPRSKSTDKPGKAVGDMVEITRHQQEMACYRMLAEKARAMGYKPAWVGIQFRKLTGRYPNARDMGDNPWLATRVAPDESGRFTRVWAAPNSDDK